MPYSNNYSLINPLDRNYLNTVVDIPQESPVLASSDNVNLSYRSNEVIDENDVISKKIEIDENQSISAIELQPSKKSKSIFNRFRSWLSEKIKPAD